MPLFAAVSLWFLARGSQSRRDTIIAAGAVPRLVVMLKGNHRWAAEVLAVLADGFEAHAEIVMAAGDTSKIICVTARVYLMQSNVGSSVLCPLQWHSCFVLLDSLLCRLMGVGQYQ